MIMDKIKMFLPICLICTFFVTIWLCKYPSIYWDSLMFRNNDGRIGTAVSIGSWAFFIGFVSTFVFLAEIIIKL